ncbi:MAG: hypothetical protein RMJ33_10005 [Saprospiraceae bacterium]|nr:hypothetical protein [Saprospiraceae bacterium]MDW8230158.1 hypothetical protein [Saprospiraceae bacterium]
MELWPFINFERLKPWERIVIERDLFTGRLMIRKEPRMENLDGCLSWVIFLILLALAFAYFYL